MSSVSEPSELSPAESRAAGPATSRRLLGLAVAIRPRQWVKNLACLAGLIFSGRLIDATAVARASAAFAAFSVLASSIYVFNDLCDRDADRRHPNKRRRPIPSGLVPAAWAGGAALALAALGVAISAALPRACLAIAIAYLAMNLAYSLRLKHAVLLDVIVIALGFVLRVLFGVYAVQVLPSAWIVLCMFFLALFLGFAKRRSELGEAGDGVDVSLQRRVLRIYSLGYLDLMLGMTATMALVSYSLYTVTGRPGESMMVVTVPLVFYGIVRYMLMVLAYGLGQNPEKQLIGDRVSLAIVAAWTALCVAIIYFERFDLGFQN